MVDTPWYDSFLGCRWVDGDSDDRGLQAGSDLVRGGYGRTRGVFHRVFYRSEMSNKSRKKFKAINPDARLTTEQERALAQWQRDYQKAAPLIVETQAVAQRIWQELLNADEWRIAESVPPEHLKPKQPELWSVGHAKVNIVDHIDIKEDPQ